MQRQQSRHASNPWFWGVPPFPSFANPTSFLGPLGNVELVGDGVIRAVTLEMPIETARSFLPYTLELAPQTMTRPGTHPIVMFFQEMVRAHMTVPSLLPNMTYHEYVLAVPHTRTTGAFGMGSSAHMQFMPKLYLSEWLPTLGGLFFWGFAKQMAHYRVTSNKIAISSYRAEDPLVSLNYDYEPDTEFKPVSEYSHFGPLQEIMSEPLVSQLPAAMGPFLVCSNYDKIWSQALLRPISTEITVHESFVPNLPTGIFPGGKSITTSALGAVEIRAPWKLSVLYPPWMA